MTAPVTESAAMAFADVMDVMRVLLETVAGYRQQCLDNGFNETAAEMMAVQFHSALLIKAFSP